MGTRVALITITSAAFSGIAAGRSMRVRNAGCSGAWPCIWLELAGFASLAVSCARGILVLACFARRAQAASWPRIFSTTYPVCYGCPSWRRGCLLHGTQAALATLALYFAAGNSLHMVALSPSYPDVQTQSPTTTSSAASLGGSDCRSRPLRPRRHVDESGAIFSSSLASSPHSCTSARTVSVLPFGLGLFPEILTDNFVLTTLGKRCHRFQSGSMAVGSELRALQRGAQEEILQDRGDANGKGRGALRRLFIIGLVITTATILVGIGSKSDDETLIEWGTDVAEVGRALWPCLAPPPAHARGVGPLRSQQCGTCAGVGSLARRSGELCQQRAICGRGRPGEHRQWQWSGGWGRGQKKGCWCSQYGISSSRGTVESRNEY